MAFRSKQTEIHPPPKLQGGVEIGGVAVEAEFVHCYKYSVVDLQIIICIRMHVTLVYPIYPPVFAFQPEHSLEVSCLLTLLVWTWWWSEHCFVYVGKPFMSVCILEGTKCHSFIKLYKGWIKIMARVRYFWRGFIHRAFICSFSIIALLIYHLLPNVWKRCTPSERPSLLMFRTDRPIAQISSSLVLYRFPRSGSFSLAKRSLSHRLRGKWQHLVVQNPIILHGNARGHTSALTDLLRRW